MARAHLNPGGVVTQWIPLYETDLRSVKSEIATFAQVFPDTTLWNPDLLEEGYDLVALGRVAAQPISEAAIDARIGSAPRVQNSLDAVMLQPRRRSSARMQGAPATWRRYWPTPRSTASVICDCSIWQDWRRTGTSAITSSRSW